MHERSIIIGTLDFTYDSSIDNIPVRFTSTTTSYMTDQSYDLLKKAGGSFSSPLSFTVLHSFLLTNTCDGRLKEKGQAHRPYSGSPVLPFKLKTFDLRLLPPLLPSLAFPAALHTF